ncbi:MAG: hypothetical protein JST61_00935, partial [Acidobacteria bacterium]|nr:hypothetical protein [Acidobacteriota bacterium]
FLWIAAHRASAEAVPRAAVTASAASLPDSPGASFEAATGFSSSNAGAAAWPWQTNGAGPKPMALPRIKFISAGQPAPKQKAVDKVELGLRESVTPFSVVGWVASATWSQLINSSPNYGTNGQAFAQRFGAAAALNVSKEIFSDAVLATAFHQDPRYYQLGPSHKFINRGIYAATRPIVGRTDSGRTIPNYAFILGTGGAAALTHTYYPERDITPGQVMQTWATSLGGSAVGYLLSEFGGDVIGWLHVRKHE